MGMGQLDFGLGRGSETRWARTGRRKGGQRKITSAGAETGWHGPRQAGMGQAGDIVDLGVGHSVLGEAGEQSWLTEGGAVGQVTWRMKTDPGEEAGQRGMGVGLSLPVVLGRKGVFNGNKGLAGVGRNSDLHAIGKHVVPMAIGSHRNESKEGRKEGEGVGVGQQGGRAEGEDAKPRVGPRG